MLRKLQGLLGGKPAPEEAPAEPMTEATAARLVEVFTTLTERLEALPRAEAAIERLAPTVQFAAKATEKSDRSRDKQFLELRGHITTELQQLGATLRLDAAAQGAIDVWRAIVPCLDDLDRVLAEGNGAAAPPAGQQTLSLLRAKLLAAFERLGIGTIEVVPRVTPFDPAVHEAEPLDPAIDLSGPLDDGAVVATTLTGYRKADLVLRPARVQVYRTS